MDGIWDDAYRVELKRAAEFWMDRGVIVLPVISAILPAERWPRKSHKTGAVQRDENGNTKPLFGGKLPSRWDANGNPRMLQWRKILNGDRKPPTREEVLRAFEPVSKGAAAELGSPIGFCICGSTTTVVVDLDKPELNEKLLSLVGKDARVELSGSGGLHVIVSPADGMESWQKETGVHKLWTFTEGDSSKVGEVLGPGSIAVMAPTRRSETEAYSVLQGVEPLQVEALAAISVYPTASKTKSELPVSSSPTNKGERTGFLSSVIGSVVPALKACLGKKARGLLEGDLTSYTQDGEKFDRSGTFTGFAKEAFGVENVLRQAGKPFTGSADELIELAVDCLSTLDTEHDEPIADKLDRYLASIDREGCDADLEKVLKRHSFESIPPELRKKSYHQIQEERFKWLSDEAPFTVCGYDEAHLYVLPVVSGLIQALKLEKLRQETQLCLLTPDGEKTWFYSPFTYETEKGRQVIDWNAIGDMLASSRQMLSIFNPEMIRGRGCWIDDGRAVMHLGDELVLNCKRMPINTIQSRFIYAKSRDLPGPAETPLSDEEANTLADILSRFNWEKPADHFHLLGWIVSALICGAVPWRPNAHLTGPSGAGKTTVLESFVEPLLAGLAFKTNGSGSEAGIRQSLKHDSLPVIFDEIEGESRADKARIKALYQLMRGASSPGGAQVVKGSSSGVAQTFLIRSNFLLSSINVGLENEADINRTAVLTLRPLRKEQVDNRDETDQLLADITQETGRKLLARVLNQIDVILENCRVFKRACSQHRGTARAGDVYGTLAACALAFFPEGDRVLTVPEALDILRRYAPLADDEVSPTEVGGDGADRDAQACLDLLLTLQLRVARTVGIDKTQRTVSLLTALEAIAGVHSGYEDIEVAFRDVGLKVINHVELAVSPDHPVLAKHFADSPWASSAWSRALKRHPLCHSKEVRFGHVKKKGTPFFVISDLVAVPDDQPVSPAHNGLVTRSPEHLPPWMPAEITCPEGKGVQSRWRKYSDEEIERLEKEASALLA